MEGIKDEGKDMQQDVVYHVKGKSNEPQGYLSFTYRFGRDVVGGCHCGQRKSCREEEEMPNGMSYTRGWFHAGVLVSVPTVALQGLAILLADAATQTETSEDEASPRICTGSVSCAPWESSRMHLTS
nr:hypothetical protein [Tanacetum cinerariifolium]